MIPRELVGTAYIPGGETMRLYRRGGDHMILVDREELMSTRMSGSEEALATMTIDRLGAPEPNLLIGGYGMGFTLRAALAMLPSKGRVTVAELVPDILDWARGPMAAITGDCLDDPRVTIRIGDVVEVIAEGRGAYDAILLDVDNGPDGLVRTANNRLYSPAGLATARAALRPGGIMTIWSAGEDPSFTRRLREAGFRVEEQVVRARQNGKGPRHHLWFAGI
ncbi:spermidine synthase [Sphingomonas sp. LY160]|uniref:spermidine synthase n=1 Tax=Sphingomonas sp. LY160 TaxID=3095342 RepID=UPI002ADEECC3|nr:spermidine synthase [Sphingomonas sp. LY160]MEA1073170.1 spermidine synthase [Sphingomonas sp. LY160]